MRYKQSITTFDNALDAILNLRGVTYDWNREAWKDRNFPAGRQVGFIAQEVEQILPELVMTDSNGYKSVAYANVVPILVEAIKAQQKQIEAIKKDNEKIRKHKDAEIAELRTKLDALAEAVSKLQNDRK